MTPEMEGAGGSTPPAPRISDELAARPSDTGEAWRWEGPGGPTSLGQILSARHVLVEISVGSEVGCFTGQVAKALIALAAAGERGLSPDEAAPWCAQLGSPVCDIRRELGQGAIDTFRPRGERTRYRLVASVRLLKVSAR